MSNSPEKTVKCFQHTFFTVLILSSIGIAYFSTQEVQNWSVIGLISALGLSLSLISAYFWITISKKINEVNEKAPGNISRHRPRFTRR
jgi:hypothetical protein